MLTVFLSDRALKDFSDNPNDSSECLKILASRINSLEENCICQDRQITRLKYFKPSALRFRHFCNSIWYRIVFTIGQDESLIVHRILPRSEINYRKDLPEYLYANLQGDEIPFLELIDVDNEQYLNNSANSSIDYDQDYQDYGRHYRLPQSLIERANSPEELANYVLTGNYLYAPKLTSEQKEYLSLNSFNQTSHIIPVQGAAGTGKTTLAFHLADVAINQGLYPLIVVPNSDIQQSGKSLINGLEKNYHISLELKSDQNADLSIVTSESFFRILSGDSESELSSDEANELIRQALIDHINLPEDLKKVDFYRIQQALLEPGNQYEIPKKDGLVAEKTQAIDKLEELENRFRYVHKEFSDLYGNRDSVSNARKALEKIKSLDEGLNSLIYSDKPIALIVDEVQDFYWIKIKIFYACHKKHRERSLLILLGDENQRITISGFTWSALADSLRREYGTNLPKLLNLSRNFRNTKAIARVAKFFLKDAFRKVFAGRRHPITPPEPETCFEEGFPPRLIEFDDKWIFEFIDKLKSTSSTRGSSRFVFIVNSASAYHSHFRQEFGSDLNQAVVLNVQQSKGQEFDAVILVSPFILRNKNISLGDLFEWYTSITRARRYEAILVTSQEMQWLRTKISQFSELETFFSICSNPDPKEFIRELTLEGRSFLTIQQLQKIFIENVSELIADWITTVHHTPQFADSYQRYNLKWWDICEKIEPKVEELLHDKEIERNKLEALVEALRAESSPQNLSILFFGTKKLLTQAQIDIQPIASLIVQQLEQEFCENPPEVLQDLDQFESYELQAILLRVAGKSWQAADLLKQHSDDEWIEGVASDLERRGIAYEAKRLRIQYLNLQCPTDDPLQTVLNSTEPLTVALCNYFVNSMEELT